MPAAREKWPHCWPLSKCNSLETKVCRRASLNVKPWSRWAAAAEDNHSGCHFRQPRTGNWAHQNSTLEDWKTITWSDESQCPLQHSDGVTNMSCINSSGWWVQCNGIKIFSLGPLAPTGYHLNTTAYLSIIASLYDHTVPIFWWLLMAG